MEDSSRYTSLEEVPGNIALFHPKLWTYAFLEAASKLDYEINRISVVRRLSKLVDVIGIMSR